ncbi:MAG: class I SAM-dependent methyltransferase [Bacteroidales bacterium]|nr:class I SAM-dependent methyltransferase [Bacteroidales bacterium]
MNFSLGGNTYKWIIDPLLSGAQKIIIKAVEPTDRVVDIACGTGSLSMAMALVSLDVKGIDLSEDMIKFASENADKKKISNVSFSAMDASDLTSFNKEEFSVAVTSMSIHQFDPQLAIQILKEMKRIAGKLILMDYTYPLKRGFTRSVVYSIEWLAGGDHWKNFRKYNKLGGLEYYLREAGLDIKKELYRSSAFRVLVCE